MARTPMGATAAVLLCACSCGNPPAGPPPDGGDATGDPIDANVCPTVDAGPVSMLPIDHVVVIVKENHTFDNYFGSFPGAAGTTVATTSTGAMVPVGRPPQTLPRDLCHEHSCALTDWNGGAMNGWDLSDSRNSDNLPYDQYVEADIPNYWQYARTFALADHFFASQLGPSFPGHSFVLSAQAGWAVGNPSQLFPWGCDDVAGTTVDVQDQTTCTIAPAFPCFDFPTIPDLLPPAVCWKFYGTNFFGEVWSMFDAVDHIRNGPQWRTHVVDDQTFDTDAANGTLPHVAYLVDESSSSEHPPFNICEGENWTVSRVNAVMQGPLWSRTAILITWDDFGGWYDHVPPPRLYGCDPAAPYGLGFRLPLIIVSTYARPGFLLSTVADHASIPRFIEAVFGLPALGDPAAQDAAAGDLTPAFDFTQAPLPPLVLPLRNCLGQR